MAGWRRSGESASAYCRARELKLTTMKYWVKKLSKEAKEPGFARVRKRRLETYPPLRVHCGGALVEVPSSFDAKAFGQVMAVLRSAGREGGTR